MAAVCAMEALTLREPVVTFFTSDDDDDCILQPLAGVLAFLAWLVLT